MCGISGLWQRKKSNGEIIVRRMSEILAHRGPDDGGIWCEESIVFGHRRLAIIDLRTGKQPMTTEDGRYTIVFNGEIYNYLELREEIKCHGARFCTDSDTEVLLQGYAHWGLDILNRLIGMFAFAIWDRNTRTLLLARDRIGKKPLLYFWDGQTFAFASEIKALLEVPACKPKLSPEAVNLYFALGYVPAPYAIYRNVHKLPPGHYLSFNEGQLKINRYWYPENVAALPALRLETRIAEFRERFSESVRIRLRSDVPVGLFLSGGIDSSAVAVELVARGHKLLALSVAFDEDHTDLPYATCVAKYLGLPHEVIEVSGNVANDLERILWHYDEPFADTSSIPSFYIAQAARNSCKVILNGDGGDEAFGGYRHYEYIGLKQGLKRLACAAGLRDGSPLDHWQVYFQSKAIFRRGERIALLNKKGIETEEVFDHFIDNQPFLTSARTNNALQRALWADRSVQLPDCYLYKMDIALSAFGMEGRSPFLDHRLLEWAQKLPTSDLVVKREKKILLRAAFRGQLPNEVLNRPKWGFGAPAMRWLRGSLAHLVKEHIPMPLLASAPQQHVLEAIQRSDGDRHVMRIWSLLIFSLWCQKWRADW